MWIVPWRFVTSKQMQNKQKQQKPKQNKKEDAFYFASKYLIKNV